MAKAKPTDIIDVNFDGLTDSVTNLVGAIILLVVLIVGVTTNALQKAPAPNEAMASQSGEFPVDALLQQVVVLQAQIDGADQQVRLVARQVAEIRRQLSQQDHPTTSESVE